MKTHGRWSTFELDAMLPFERDVYYSMLLKEKKKK